MSISNYLKNSLRRYFFSGLLVIVPLIITFVVLRFFLLSVDGVLSPFLIKYLGYDIPGLGFAIVIVLIFITGILTRGVVGRELVRLWEIFLSQLPFVRPIYTAAKQLLVSIAEPKAGMFKRVVIIPYPRQGVYCFAFAANEVAINTSSVQGAFLTVFVPSTPTPFTGFVVMVKKEEVFPTDISVEDAIKFVVSGGIVAPPKLLATGITGVETT